VDHVNPNLSNCSARMKRTFTARLPPGAGTILPGTGDFPSAGAGLFQEPPTQQQKQQLWNRRFTPINADVVPFSILVPSPLAGEGKG
jgi:hypothetical protein